MIKYSVDDQIILKESPPYGFLIKLPLKNFDFDSGASNVNATGQTLT